MRRNFGCHKRNTSKEYCNGFTWRRLRLLALLLVHFKLSCKQSPSTQEEKTDMDRVPYAFAVGSLMYAMVCTRPDLAYVVGSC